MAKVGGRRTGEVHAMGSRVAKDFGEKFGQTNQ